MFNVLSVKHKNTVINCFYILFIRQKYKTEGSEIIESLLSFIFFLLTPFFTRTVSTTRIQNHTVPDLISSNLMYMVLVMVMVLVLVMKMVRVYILVGVNLFKNRENEL